MPPIRLFDIAHARGGDKGASANIGVIARTPVAFEFLCNWLTPARVEAFFKPMGVRHVTRYELPNLGALNFILSGILETGGSTSLRIDAQGKALGQAMLEMELEISVEMLARLQLTPEARP